MQEINYVITDEMGLHARPAGLFVKNMQKYKAQMRLKCKGKACDAKRIFGVMGLAVKKGNQITLEIEGEDEDQAASEIATFLEENL